MFDCTKTSKKNLGYYSQRLQSKTTDASYRHWNVNAISILDQYSNGLLQSSNYQTSHVISLSIQILNIVWYLCIWNSDDCCMINYLEEVLELDVAVEHDHRVQDLLGQRGVRVEHGQHQQIGVGTVFILDLKDKEYCKYYNLQGIVCVLTSNFTRLQ